MALAAARRPAPPRRVVRPSATENPVRAVDAGVVQIPAPLPYVADHVVETPGVRRLGRDLVHPVAGVPAIPGDLVEFAVAHTGVPGPSRVLPLRLGGKSIAVGRPVAVHVPRV